MVVYSERVSEIMRDFKSYTAREIIRVARANQKDWLLNQFDFYKKRYKQSSEYQVWQEGFHPKMIDKEEVFMQKVEYIHNNPVRRGLVESAEHWRYSSAGHYLCGESCIEIDQLDL